MYKTGARAFVRLGFQVSGPPLFSLNFSVLKRNWFMPKSYFENFAVCEDFSCMSSIFSNNVNEKKIED